MGKRIALTVGVMLGVLPLAATVPAIAETLTHGYIEGEFVWIGLPDGGVLKELSVERGNNVTAGDPLFALDDERESALHDAAGAALDAARARLLDLSKASRESEIAAVRALLDQARAEQELARLTLARRSELRGTVSVSEESLNLAEADFARTSARVEQYSAQLRTAGLAAREDQIASAAADVQRAEAALREQDWRLGLRQAQAPADATVEDTFYRPGEFVPAGRPVVSLLPPGNIKLRFFVPEGSLAQFQLGDTVPFSCDGCTAGLSARITYIAPAAEYTPPVIYSEAAREKLVFLVEAKPVATAAFRPALLHPGQPVDVVLP